MKNLIFIMLSVLVLYSCTGCSGSHTDGSEGNTVMEGGALKLIYPEKPPELKLLDVSILENKDQWGTANGHDPAIFKDEASGKYYVYSTDVQIGSSPRPGAQIRCSEDLITWNFAGWAFEEGIPQEVLEYTGARNLWAPDIIKVGNEYRLYTSASTFGSQRSAIFLAVSDKPDGPFKYKGIVVKTNIGDPVNAIDANLVVEEGTGQQYMVYGSFWSGICILKLNNDTGMPAEKGLGTSIAQRSAMVNGAIEGPYIRYNSETGYYYLFVSYGSLSSNYNIRVARSKTITGPYIDYDGNEMTNQEVNPFMVGLKIAGGYIFGDEKGWMAPGHNSVLNDNGEWYIVHHIRPNGEVNWPYMQVRRLYWTDDGWPVISPEPYAGEKLQKIDAANLAGTYERVDFARMSINNVELSVKMVLNPDKTCIINDVKGEWMIEGNNTLIVKSGEATEKYLAIPGWDWENNKPAILLTGMNNKGECIWGKKTGN